MSRHQILFIGHSGDSTLRYTVARARERGYSYECLASQEFLRSGSIQWCDGDMAPIIVRSGSHIDLARVSSCFVRLYDTSHRTACGSDLLVSRSRYLALSYSLHLAPCVVVNRPFLEAGNSSKLFQLSLLSQYGFRTPMTICTNSVREAMTFSEMCNDQLICKSSSGTRSIVRRVTKEQLALMGNVPVAPVCLQQWIEGPDLRVHVVRHLVFGTLIETDAVDYRYPSCNEVRFRPIAVPDDIANMCVKFVSDVGLLIAGFDFKLERRSGECVCLEANPSPGYNGYDVYMNGAISDALLDVLWHGDRLD